MAHENVYKISMSETAARVKKSGSHFFDRSTLRFFGDSVANWEAHFILGRVFIRNVRHGAGPGMFNRCTLRGQCREVFYDGEISQALPEYFGLRPLQIAKLIEAQRAADKTAADKTAADNSTNNGECNNAG